MMRVWKKLITAGTILAFVLSCFASAFIAHSHPFSQEGILAKTYMPMQGGYYIGGETVGWSVNENYHTNGTNMSYAFDYSDINLNDEYRGYVTEGALMWQGTVSIQQSINGTGLIKTVYSPGIPQAAYFTDYLGNADGNGHLYSWSIVINRAKNVSARTLAHEFGHAIGLNDLYSDLNAGKLMYGYSDGTATGPTSSDIWGAKVITGIHTSHNWGYRYYTTISGENMHIKYCTYCNGLTSVTELCSYNSQNVCVKCGVPYGFQPYSLEEDIE